ncbi:MAG TPA: pyruvate:ferredoxin (flavodoxin) oxidoreductase, partial [Verrucomicrobiae bacterium]|nr:pyruvate:ferredoxin (flavodoxin) oxidoreductase [Verrucomicrobiae bacterium]
AGEPLYLDCVTALCEALGTSGKFKMLPKIVGGRYGLSSKEFNPGMIKAVFDNLAQVTPKNHFTVGINDDVRHTSLDFSPRFSVEPKNVYRALFYGLGSDGTVGANKDSIKIIGENTSQYVQGYFVYDSKKSGAVTVSHLRFGPHPIRSTYLVSEANFIGCHQPQFLERVEVAEKLAYGGTFLLNAPWPADEVWNHLPRSTQRHLIELHAKVYVIDANKVAREAGIGGRINTVMQVCFFSLSGVLPQAKAIDAIKNSIRKTYGKKGDEIVQINLKVVDNTLAQLREVKVPGEVTSNSELQDAASTNAPDFVRNVLGKMMAGRGDELPVSAMPVDGTYPTGTARWEKRNLATEIPVWDPNVCIQCGKCVMVCPHAVIRSKTYRADALSGAPGTFKTANARLPEWNGLNYTLQVAPEDCTGCGICVDVCPARNKSEARLKAINMGPQSPLREAERANWDFFLTLPEADRCQVSTASVRAMQTLQPMFEFSGACAGCGETPYLKLLSQLFGDRIAIANATGCSSIYGGNLPTTPWSKNSAGRGPAWSNSLFEDNAEFGLGYRCSFDKQREFATELLAKLAPALGEDLTAKILHANQKDEADIYEQREAVAVLKQKLNAIIKEDQREAGVCETATRLFCLADALVHKSVWIVGGDGWAYDIGFGGLDHVLASGRNVKVLVLDTEVYSNTGGQCSKSTPRGAIAKFASGGKPARKKDLGLIAMTYGNVYVGTVSMGAKDEHTLKTFLEAEAYDGPALIVAYSHCIAHGINMATGMQNQKAAVQSGQWLLYRYNPDRAARGLNPLQLDSQTPRIKVSQYLNMENRFKMLNKSKPEEARKLFEQAQTDADLRRDLFQYLATRDYKNKPDEAPSALADP